VELQGVAQELRPVPVPVLQLELALEQQLVQEQALLLGQPVHCGRCSQARLLG
jgi:hypothetical protein